MTALRFRCDNGEYSGQIVKRIGEMLIIEGLAQDSGLYFLQVDGGVRRFDSRKEVEDYATELARDAGFSPWDHDAGVGSYKAGRSINSNPNVVGTNEHASWEQGWNFAHRQAQELNPDKGVQDKSVSQAQHGAMGAAAGGNSQLGIPQGVGKEFMRADKGEGFDDKDDIERPTNAAMQRRDPRLNYGRPKPDDEPERPINAAMQRRDPRLSYGRDYDAGFQLGQQHAGHDAQKWFVRVLFGDGSPKQTEVVEASSEAEAIAKARARASGGYHESRTASYKFTATPIQADAKPQGDAPRPPTEQELIQRGQLGEAIKGLVKNTYGQGKYPLSQASRKARAEREAQDAPLSTKERQSGLIRRVMERMPGNPLKPPTQQELSKHAALAPRQPAPGQPYLDRPTAEEVKKAGW